MNIWLVEDSPDEAREAKQALERRFKARVTMISTHADFLDQLEGLGKNEPPDLVIMDIMLRFGRDLPVPVSELLTLYDKRIEMLIDDPRTKRVPILVWSVQDNTVSRSTIRKSLFRPFFCSKSDGVPALIKMIHSMFPDMPGLGEVFLAHGWDDGARDEVAAYIRSLGLRVVMLADEPGKGMTIIEKLETTYMTYGVILLTPDDHGSPATKGPVESRARQNVVFELGYLIARLGRNRVCALRDPTVEIPSNFSGVVYIPFTEDETWKYRLAQELRSAGLLNQRTPIHTVPPERHPPLRR
jgi:CheY-like chemotaxis protein